MIEPKPPPAAMPFTSASTSSVPLASPPEKMTMRRPLNADCTQWRTRSAQGADGDVALLARRTFFASACSMCAFGGLTLMMCAPSCAAICAA
jgi:hypothetical protein